MYFEINYNKPRLKSRDITLLTKVHTDKAVVFPIAMNGFPDSSVGKNNSPAMQETPVLFLDWKDSLEKG